MKQKRVYIFSCVFSALLCVFVILICPGPIPGVYRTELLSLEQSVKGYFMIQENHNVYGVIESNEGTRIFFIGNWEKQGNVFMITNNLTHEKLKFKAFLWGIKWVNPPHDVSFFQFIYSFRKLLGNKKFQDGIHSLE